MDIEFPDKYAIDSEGYGIVLPVIVDNKDRKSVVQGKSVDLGGRRIIKKKKEKK